MLRATHYLKGDSMSYTTTTLVVAGAVEEIQNWRDYVLLAG